MWVNYEPLPKPIFIINVNDADIYDLIKEEVDYDPTKTEALNIQFLDVNDQKIISGFMPWHIEDLEEKVQNALGMGHLNSLSVIGLDSISWVANEFLDVLCSYDLPDNGLDKLEFHNFRS